MTYEIRTESFWDRSNLLTEFRRVGGICLGCRKCEARCPSFSILFGRISETYGGRTEDLTDADLRGVADHCYDCRLCLAQCPYSPDRDPRLQIDFPRLLIRARFVRAGVEGVTARERFRSNADLTGAVGTLTAPLSNWVTRSQAGRLALEKLFGIDRRRLAPRFHRTPFERWFRKREKKLKKRIKGSGGKVALFISCSVNYHRPEVGKSAVSVLAHNDVAVVVPDQRCCGRHYMRAGDFANLRENMEFNLRSLSRYVNEGYTIVSLQPACGNFLKDDYPWLVENRQAHAVAGSTIDLMAFLASLHERKRLDRRFQDADRRILHHLPCHLRSEDAEGRTRDLLGLLPGSRVEMVASCCGMGGSWGMQKEFYEDSMRVGSALFDRIREGRFTHVVSECNAAGHQIEQGSGVRVLHPVELLREAYGLPLDR